MSLHPGCLGDRRKTTGFMLESQRLMESTDLYGLFMMRSLQSIFETHVPHEAVSQADPAILQSRGGPQWSITERLAGRSVGQARIIRY